MVGADIKNHNNTKLVVARMFALVDSNLFSTFIEKYRLIIVYTPETRLNEKISFNLP